uniref:Uncharacterized protein n=1 Tax=Tetranychus urticae TaxID=32264 RepID=T1K1Q3_TETUR
MVIKANSDLPPSLTIRSIIESGLSSRLLDRVVESKGFLSTDWEITVLHHQKILFLDRDTMALSMQIRALKVAEKYNQIGGGSPIRDWIYKGFTCSRQSFLRCPLCTNPAGSQTKSWIGSLS